VILRLSRIEQAASQLAELSTERLSTAIGQRAYEIDPQPQEGSSNMSTNTDEKSASHKRALAADLGELIRKLNPYTNKQNRETGQSTGEMELLLDNTSQSTGSPTIVGVEMEGPYAQEWTFKGAPQRVGMAARIKYRYPVVNGKDGLFWVEEHILVGFAGGMGG
jgi:hypothetical protein